MAMQQAGSRQAVAGAGCTCGLWFEGLRSLSTFHCTYSSLASSLQEAARASGRGRLFWHSAGGRPAVCRITQLMSSTIACRQW
jgi:hypothetical protein